MPIMRSLVTLFFDRYDKPNDMNELYFFGCPAEFDKGEFN
jgi:hypothetical protein